MPAVAANEPVLVTGASGFIAVHIVAQLLQRGHPVRGTVRSDDKGEYLSKLFQTRFPGAAKFTYVIAKDLEEPGAFDEAVKDVAGVVHSASPFHFNSQGRALEALINPALNGTKSVLNSVHKHGNKVKRVVVISSYAAILDSDKPIPYTFTEKDWNESSPRRSKEKGNDQEPIDAYRASKSLAERSAWDFVEKEQPSWDLATINPPLVVGPLLHQCESPDKLNTSLAGLWGLLNGAKTDADLPAPGGCLVDVRDVALATVEATTKPEAGGQRWAPTIGNFTVQDQVDILHAAPDDIVTPQRKAKVPRGKPGTGPQVTQNVLDGSKVEKGLGVKYHSMEETILDAVKGLEDYDKRGWKGLPSEEIVKL